MVKRIVTHDDVTDTCGLAELAAYPTVAAGTGVSVAPVTNGATGQVTYTVNSTVSQATIDASVAAAITDLTCEQIGAMPIVSRIGG
jgi:hypothetical protein